MTHATAAIRQRGSVVVTGVITVQTLVALVTKYSVLDTEVVCLAAGPYVVIIELSFFYNYKAD